MLAAFHFYWFTSMLFRVFQVQVKHSNCSQWPRASCVCGVAMREGETILIADACHESLQNDTLAEPKYITHRDANLPNDAKIKVSDSGRTFKVNSRTALLSFNSMTTFVQ